MAKTANKFQPVPRAVQLIVLVAAVATLVFIQPYFGAIVFSFLIAFLFNPVYKMVLKRTGQKWLASIATLAAALISIVVPLFIVISVTFSQAQLLVKNLQATQSESGSTSLDTVIDRGAERVQAISSSLTNGTAQINKDELREKIKQSGSFILQSAMDFIIAASGALTQFFMSLILSVFLIMAILKNQEFIISKFKDISPFTESLTKTYMDKAGAMTNAMVKGQFIIALSQGFASALSLWLVGFEYFIFYFTILSFLSFIPLGAGIVTIPLGIIMILTGNVWPGIFILVWQYLVVSLIDNFLRPYLVPKHAMINPALMLLSVFCGLAAFGGFGVIFGPVIMIVLITTFNMYAEYSRRVQKHAPPVS